MGAHTVHVPQPLDEPQSTPIDPDGLYDVVIECVGRPGILGQAIARACRRGTIVSLGYCFLGDPIVPALAGGREIRMLFPQLYTMQEFRWALDVLDQGAVEPREMLTRTVSLDELPEAFEKLRGNPAQCKVVVDPSGELRP